VLGGILGSSHALDIPFGLHNLDAPGADELVGTTPTALATAPIVERVMSNAVASFIATGNPETADVPWPQHRDGGLALVISADPHLIGGPDNKRLALWRKYAGSVLPAPLSI
jgi:para-nitrobenzyl esterase